MSKPTRILCCTEPGCRSEWYQFGDNHGAAVRRAIKAGWNGDGKHGCICADDAQTCPNHATAHG